MSTDDGQIEPYRVLFPLGIVSALLGIFLWILFQNRMISFYPRQAHANIMFLACLWSFISGFLMTAVPKMTSTFSMNMAELFFGMFLVFVQLILNMRNQIHLAVGVFAIQLSFLLIFLMRRFLVRKTIPFEGFFFLPFAFAQGFLGVVCFYIAKGNNFELFYALAGEAFVINLIIGLGSRLIPVISRCPNALMPNITSPMNSKAFVFSLALLLNAGFILETLIQLRVGSAFKFIAVLIISFKYLGLHKKPTTFSVVAYGLKAGILMLIGSLSLEVLDLSTIAAAHLLYIGVFLLITLMVATRVMLAHGQQSTDYEIRSMRIVFVLLLLLFASFARYFAGVDINSGLMSLAIYSSFAALLMWSHKFVKILFKFK